jgi:phosphatidylserine/phosphatidylglycerophosphate/cardiolipin synthase-like enzyme
MSAPEIDAILRQTWADRRLSRGERRVVQSMVAQLGGDPAQRGLVRSRAFALAQEMLAGESAEVVIEWLEDVVKAVAAPPEDNERTADAHFSPGHDCARAIVHLLERTHTTLDICVFTITDDRISDAVLDAHRRGVKTRVITDNDKSFDPGSDVERLGRLGVPVRVDQSEYHMHHKFALLDATYLMTGSYNWTRSAARCNEENFVVVDEPRLVRQFSDEFEKLWKSLG